MTDQQNDQVATNPDSYIEVKAPTWHGNIKHFFREKDLTEMKKLGLDLSSYSQVKGRSGIIYRRVTKPEGHNRKMPPDLTWAKGRTDTFNNWIENDHAPGKVEAGEEVLAQAGDVRIRKNINALNNAEKADLIKAFNGIMSRKYNEENSYYQIAKIHGNPPPYDCVHGDITFNHWHRLYMLQMENALRSVPGCEHVTLPYWDLTDSSIPALLDKAPFLNYTIPGDVPDVDAIGNKMAGYTSRRNPNDTIINILKSTRAAMNIPHALGQNWYDSPSQQAYGGYAQKIEDDSHDPAHGSIGGSNTNSSYASFDPIFWFFHCNWDRLMWEWQQRRNATNYISFLANLQHNDKTWVDTDMQKSGTVIAKPKDLINNNNIDLESLGIGKGIVSIGYETIGAQNLSNMEKSLKDYSISSAAKFSLPAQPMASVIIKGVHRLNIEGGFFINLYAGDKLIGSAFEFQFLDPTKCKNCVATPVKNYTIKVPVNDLVGELRVEIRLPDEAETLVKMADVGSPTLNIRLLLE